MKFKSTKIFATPAPPLISFNLAASTTSPTPTSPTTPTNNINTTIAAVTTSAKASNTNQIQVKLPSLLSSNELQIPTQLRASNNSINKITTKIYATASTNTDFVLTASVSTNTVAVECNLDDPSHCDQASLDTSSCQTQTESNQETSLPIDNSNSLSICDSTSIKSKVFFDLENFLKNWLSPPKCEQSSSENENSPITHTPTSELPKSPEFDVLENFKVVKFILDSYTNLTVKENFTKIDANNLAYVNLNQMLNSPEFNLETTEQVIKFYLLFFLYFIVFSSFLYLIFEIPHGSGYYLY